MKRANFSVHCSIAEMSYVWIQCHLIDCSNIRWSRHSSRNIISYLVEVCLMILFKIAWTMVPWRSRKTIHPITLLFLEPKTESHCECSLVSYSTWLIWVVQTLLFLQRGAPTEAKCFDAACAWGLLQSLAWLYSQADPHLPSQPRTQLPHLYWWACIFHKHTFLTSSLSSLSRAEGVLSILNLVSYFSATMTALLLNYFVAVHEVGFEGFYILRVWLLLMRE